MNYEISINEPVITTTQIQKISFLALEKGFKTVSVPINFLSQVKEYIDNSKIRLGAIIDNSFSNTPTELKHAAILLASRRGAKVIELGLNHSWMKEDKHAEIRKEIKSCVEICDANKLELRASLEYRLFEESELFMWAEYLTKLNVNTLVTSGGLFIDDPIDNILITKRIEKAGSGIEVITASNVLNKKHIQLAEDSKIKTLRFISLPMSGCGV